MIPGLTNPELPVIENLRRNILPAHAWMVDESRILLQDFITDLHNSVGIMRAIADGQQALSDISGRTGLNSSKASFYLSVLRDTGFDPVHFRNMTGGIVAIHTGVRPENA